jgi:predicted dehydrogenase
MVTLAKTGKGEDPNCTLKEQSPELGPGGGWENAVHYFIDCVIAGKEPFVSGEEGRETIKAILAAYESDRLGKWIKVR